MSLVTSCTLLSHGPVVRPAVVYSSGRPAAAVAVASLSSQIRRPRPLSVCCATSQKGDHNPKPDLHPFNIPAFVLVHPVPPREERWQLEEDGDKVNLWFEVPGQSRDDLAVEMVEDVLVIKRNKDVPEQTRRGGTAAEASKEAAKQAAGEVIYARMLLPAVYSREGVSAELKSGVLRVTVAKIKDSARRKINVPIQDK